MCNPTLSADLFIWADFVRDIPKSHVLTLRGVMRPPTADDPLDGPVFRSDTVIRTAVHAVAASEKPIRIVDDGVLLGVVDRAHVLEAIAGDTVVDGQVSDGIIGQPPRPTRVGIIDDPTESTAQYIADVLVDPESGASAR